jgi:hypothetical protein
LGDRSTPGSQRRASLDFTCGGSQALFFD